MTESPDTNTEGRRRILKGRKYAPATGIQPDFEKILTSFVETKSVRYEEFAKIWREKKLSLICAGRQTDREAVEFMEECMKVAFRMFLPPYGFQARVGALYLLYSLYMTQPCVPKVKIRVMQGDWTQIKSMQEEFVKQNHHDTNFILHKLLVDGAFFFCAVPIEVRNRYNQPEDSNKTMAEVLREDRQRIDDLFSDEIMEQLDLVHDQYHRQKVRLAGPDASRPDRSLDVLLDKFPLSVRDLLRHHHEQWKMKEASRQGNRSQSLPTIPEGESEDMESESDMQESNDIGERRARLKAIAFRGAKNKQRYKHRRLATETSSSEEKNSPSPPKKKRGRPRGTKHGVGIQRSAMSTITEQEEENTVVVGEDGLLHMPHFDVAPEEREPGRKRKARPTTHSETASPTKRQKTTDKAGTASTAEETDNEVSEEAELLPVMKRPRGRPPKPKPGKVGRPPKPKTDSPLETDAVDQPSKSKPDTPRRTSKVGRPPKAKPDTPAETDTVDEPSTSKRDTPGRTGKVGRPPKPKPDTPVRIGKVGRPPKPKPNIPMKTGKRGRPPKRKADTPMRTGKVGQPPKPKADTPGKVGRPRNERALKDRTSGGVESTQSSNAEIGQSDGSESISSQAMETTCTLLAQSQQSTSVEPNSADKPASADEPTSGDELVSTDAPASVEDEDGTSSDPEQPRMAESRKRPSTDDREDSREGSKVGRKEGSKGQREGLGKGARLKVTPLQVQIAGKGKKKT